MMDRLPELIDPVVFAERRTELVGKLELGLFTRLAEFMTEAEGKVNVQLSFNKQGRDALIDGSVQTELLLQCQNCLEPVAVPLDVVIKLGIVTVLEQADRLPEGYEPLLASGEKMSLREIVEDELLLALPAFPKHDFQCVDLTKHSSGLIENSAAEAQSKPNNPFAVLAKFN